MRVLVANKFWYRRGGLESVMFDEVAWLTAAGHEVAHYSTMHPSNDESPWSKYFAPYLELGGDGGLSLADKMVATTRMFWNREAARRFSLLLADFHPDVIHVHGIHRQISPSILAVARRQGVPVVQTLHDHHHICPAGVLLYRGCEVCEPRRCGKLWYGPAVTGRCVHGSWSVSALSAAEMSFQRLRRAYEHGVARFISPSRFVADSMLAGGWSVPIDVVPNAVARSSAMREMGDGFCLIGRLSPEKGVSVALHAARIAGVRLTVAGEGPMDLELRKTYPEVEFVGRLNSGAVAELVHRSRAVVVPSLCLENAPMSVLEAMAAGRPAIASAIGGIPELITDGVDGLLVPAGNVDALAIALRRIADSDSLASSLGHAAQRTVEARFSPAEHIRGVMSAYAAAGAKGGDGGEY